MRLKASVIVPVYNVERYLPRCIESILSQEYVDWELILVDDGSTDSSGCICDAYAVRDDRIQVIHQENKGLSGARNTGIQHSKGDVLFFVDSDDYVTAQLISRALNALEHTQSDMVMFNARQVYGDRLAKLFGYEIPGDIEDTEYLRKWFLMGEDSHVFKRAYRRECYRNLSFPEGFNYEDLAVNVSSLFQARQICAIPDVLYMYESEEHGSITQTRSLRNMRGLFYGWKRSMEDLPSAPEYDEYRNLFRMRTLILLFYILYRIRASDTVSDTDFSVAFLKETFDALSKSSDPWYGMNLETVHVGVIQEFSYAAHVMTGQIQRGIRASLNLENRQNNKNILGYVLRMFSLDSIFHILPDGSKHIFIIELWNLSGSKEIHKRLEQKILSFSVKYRLQGPLKIEGRHLLKKGMRRE